MANETPDLDRLDGVRRPLPARRRRLRRPARRPRRAPAGTYFATIILRWARLLNGEPALVETAGFQPLFNGKDLDGWEGDTSLWSARDGMLVGHVEGPDAQRLPRHRQELTATSSSSSRSSSSTARGTAASSSGASASRATRCRATRPTSARTTGAASTTSRAATRCSSRRPTPRRRRCDKTAWNQYVIDAKGDDIRLSLNGVTSVDVPRGRPRHRPRRPDRRPAPRGRADGGPVQGHLHPAPPRPEGGLRRLARASTCGPSRRAGDEPEVHGLHPAGLRRQEGVPRRPVPARVGRARRGRRPGRAGRASGRRSSTTPTASRRSP